MGNKMKKSKLLKFIGMILVLAVVVFSSIMAYKEVIIPKKYNKYIELGNEHIAEEHYRQAIYDFESALRIDKNSIEALLGLSKSYVGISDDEKVKECVMKAQSLDLKDENLVLEILDIVSKNDRETIRTVVENYIEEVGYDNVSERFQLTVFQMTNKNELSECIDRAETIYEKLDRGKVNNELLDYKVTLGAYIKTGKEVNNGYFYTQYEVNQMTEALKKLISRFSEV